MVAFASNTSTRPSGRHAQSIPPKSRSSRRATSPMAARAGAGNWLAGLSRNAASSARNAAVMSPRQ